MSWNNQAKKSSGKSFAQEQREARQKREEEKILAEAQAEAKEKKINAALKLAKVYERFQAKELFYLEIYSKIETCLLLFDKNEEKNIEDDNSIPDANDLFRMVDEFFFISNFQRQQKSFKSEKCWFFSLKECVNVLA
eukprot:Pgem_evm1s340